MGSFRRLKVWQASHRLACELYVMTRGWPAVHRYGLGDQIRRASISIGANIAEGCGRNGDPEFARFISIALGSANELYYLLMFASDVQAVSREAATPLMAGTDEVRRMLSALRATAARGSPRSPSRRLEASAAVHGIQETAESVPASTRLSAVHRPIADS